MKPDCKIQKEVSGEFTGEPFLSEKNLDIKLLPDIPLNDSEIEQAVLSELKWNTAVREDKVRVKVKNGIVILNGKANWGFKRMAMVRDEIKNLPGVEGIINNVKMTSALQNINPDFHSHAISDVEN